MRLGLNHSDVDQAGDEGDLHERFVRLFTRERRRIYAYTFSLIPVPADAEDIFQQVSIVLWRKFDQFDPNRDFFAWACGFVYYTVLNYRRSQKRGRLLFSDDLVRKLSDDRVNWARGENEMTGALEDCLSMLKPEDRRLLAEVYGMEKSPAAVAEERQRAVRTIYNRLCSIRRNLLNCVQLKMSTKAGTGNI